MTRPAGAEVGADRVVTRCAKEIDVNTLTDATTYDVVLKGVEPIRVASIRGVVPSVDMMGEMFNTLFSILEDYAQANGGVTGSPMAIYHDSGSGPKMLNMRVELAIPVGESAEGKGQVRVYEVPGVEEMACVIHEGPFETISNAYAALDAWMRENGYKVAGQSREIYLRSGEEESLHYTTEVQVPAIK
jgi:effector-binding domain-containing protein